MEWQDALRRLDQDLAAGRIGRPEHTKRRDEILAAAAGPRPHSRLGTSPLDTEATQVIRPVPAPYPSMAPPVDGHVVFATARKRKGRWTGLLLIALLGVTAAGVWWFVGRDSGTAGAAATTTVTTTTGTTTAATPAAAGLPALPGAATVPDRTMTVDEAVAAKLLSLTESDVLRAGGVDEVRYAASTAGKTSYAVVVARTSGPDQARKVAAGLARHLKNSGYAETPEGHLRKAEPTTVVRGVYTSGDHVVRVGVAEATPDADLTAPVTDVLGTVRRAFPPD
ncbi:hypothetical protein AB0A74_11930 [Saccharothrix sp. NPDC042600]|uniref:hypothetical protein n=1 Tax=Saccharothrix TaxID=2071 RepID=UPI0033E7867A|nr:hypothetical protein GCM10017745_06040 [Saccharothrix mutabilis subsp. capreolus]